MLDPDLLTIVALTGAAVLAGFVDSIAGGGGLVTVPALLAAGFDPLAAIATNKLQSTFGAASAAHAYGRAGLFDREGALPLMVACAALGSVAGAFLIQRLPLDWLTALLPVLLVAVALYFALKPRPSDADAARRLSPLAFALTVAVGVGFYDGAFGPGTGSFFMLGFVTLLGQGLLKATAHTKLLNLASNAAGLLVFIFGGHVVFAVGIPMAAGQWVGAKLGSRLALRHGAPLIRPLLVLVCLAVAARLVADPGHPLWRLLD